MTRNLQRPSESNPPAARLASYQRRPRSARQHPLRSRLPWLLPLVAWLLVTPLRAQDSANNTWKYRAELLRPFWLGTVMEGESVLFIRDAATGEARASVLFPIRQIRSVSNSSGSIVYDEGRDYVWKPDSREIVLPRGSRITSSTPQDLRRPAKSQKYELTHRDGNGEIFFGGRLEYHDLQTCVTYEHAPDAWRRTVPSFDPRALPRSLKKLNDRRGGRGTDSPPFSVVVLGDSISSGCNASGWAGDAPYQPAYPELFRRALAEHYQANVVLANPSVSGRDTGWALSMVDAVVEHRPDLVVIAFGMNDSAGRPADEYRANTQALMDRVRARAPDVEFILVATMLGNRDWTRLKHELFPQYRDSLQTLRAPGVAVADLTSVWEGFLELKRDWDQTGNGVNHPNDFGHRVYAQVIASLLVPTP